MSDRVPIMIHNKKIHEFEIPLSRDHEYQLLPNCLDEIEYWLSAQDLSIGPVAYR
jgi:hypothetical protein